MGPNCGHSGHRWWLPIPYWIHPKGVPGVSAWIAGNDLPLLVNERSPILHRRGTNHRIKILVPKKLRGDVLELLHAADQGVNGMLANTRQWLFWPGLNTRIHQTKAECKTCNTITTEGTLDATIKSQIPVSEDCNRLLWHEGKKLYGLRTSLYRRGRSGPYVFREHQDCMWHTTKIVLHIWCPGRNIIWRTTPIWFPRVWHIPK